MTQNLPDPDTSYPIRLANGAHHKGTVFLKAVLEHPRIDVGDYTYFSSHQPFEGPDDIAARLAPYLYPHSPEKLSIGKFCQIAHGAQFVTASANHRYDGFSTFPFAIFTGGIGEARPSLPSPGNDTYVGNDVWIGTGAIILPGAQIGSGVIIGAGSVVVGKVPDYTIVAGNPARPVRLRFSPDIITRLLKAAWWEWPIERIAAAEAEICGGDIDALERLARK